MSNNNGWISVEERLPADGTSVLIAILHKYSNVPHEYSLAYVYYKHSKWLQGTHHLIKPTHWMQLPEPPEVTK